MSAQLQEYNKVFIPRRCSVGSFWCCFVILKGMLCHLLHRAPSFIPIVLTLTTRGIGFTEQNCVCFLKILTFYRLFQELLNQYQAYLYSVKCISQGDSKYGYEIPKCWHFLPNLLNCGRRLHSPAAWKTLSLIDKLSPLSFELEHALPPDSHIWATHAHVNHDVSPIARIKYHVYKT